LTFSELQVRLATIADMASDAVPTLAAAVYYYLPFPPAVFTAWDQSVRELRRLVWLVLARSTDPRERPRTTPGGRSGFSRRLSPSAMFLMASTNRTRRWWESTPMAIPSLSMDATPRSGRRRRPGSRDFLLGLLRDVLRIVEGAGVAQESVKRAFNRAHRAYERAFPLKPIDLTRLDQVVHRPRGRYVLVQRQTGPCGQDRRSPERQRCARFAGTESSAWAHARRADAVEVCA
jgi:hypothetical protein